VLHKLHRFQLSPGADRARIDVIRHRIRSHLSLRGRLLLAAAGALACLGVATLAANAASPGADPGTPAAASGEVLADRDSAAERSDRADRSEAGRPGEAPGESADEAGGKPAGKRDSEPAAEAPNPEKSPKAAAAKPEQKPQAPAQEKKPDWVHPMPGAATTSCYGSRWGSAHAGVDLASPPGTPIRAVGAGTVAHAGWVFSGYGKSVMIRHRNGVFTHYAHASKVEVSPGEKVSPGETIALEGSTGNSSGPHLHFEVHKGKWNQVEPTNWLAKRGVTIEGC
jgi:murein DD-endopeptidase MepM/ murein hydrolase activator NlpD